MVPLDMLLAPILGPLQIVQWLGQKLIEAAEIEAYDEDKVQGELVELQVQYDMGEITEEEYCRYEELLLERMNAIRKAKG